QVSEVLASLEAINDRLACQLRDQVASFREGLDKINFQLGQGLEHSRAVEHKVDEHMSALRGTLEVVKSRLEPASHLAPDAAFAVSIIDHNFKASLGIDDARSILRDYEFSRTRTLCGHTLTKDLRAEAVRVIAEAKEEPVLVNTLFGVLFQVFPQSDFVTSRAILIDGVYE